VLSEVDFWVKDEIWKAGVMPFMRVRLNYRPPGQKAPITVIECNPNKFAGGHRDFVRLLKLMFGDRWGLVRSSRIDLNADIVGVPVYFYRQSVRIPRKRKAVECGTFAQSFNSAGVETYGVGRSPDLTRFYNKIKELDSKGTDTAAFPPVLTRVEREMQYRKCPVATAEDIPKLQNYRPFDNLQFFVTPQIAALQRLDHPDSFYKQYVVSKMAEDFGMHETARILNKSPEHRRQFMRDFRDVLGTVDQQALRQQLENAYLDSITRFFNNECSDVRAIHGRLPTLERPSEPLSGSVEMGRKAEGGPQ
jgi:hypothetical protein